MGWSIRGSGRGAARSRSRSRSLRSHSLHPGATTQRARTRTHAFDTPAEPEGTLASSPPLRVRSFPAATPPERERRRRRKLAPVDASCTLFFLSPLRPPAPRTAPPPATMYIKEVTIDGFKSYAQRVVVPEFDRYFNAITVRERRERGSGRAVGGGARHAQARQTTPALFPPALTPPVTFSSWCRVSTGRASPTSWTPSSSCWASPTCPR